MKREFSGQQIAFLKSMDFLKLGQSIQHENWQVVLMCTKRMETNAKECEMEEFLRWFTGIRQCAFHRNRAEALQLMTLVTGKRVQYLNIIHSGEEVKKDGEC